MNTESADHRRSPRHAAVLAAVVILTALAGIVGTAELRAQESEPEPERWSDWVYQPGSWVEGRLVAPGSGSAQDSLALVATVEVYARGPRWRAEVRRVEEGRELAEPVVMVGRAGEVRVLTPLGATALDEHAAAEDPIVSAVAAGFDEQGRPGREVRDSRFDIATPGGGPELVAVRTVAARADFPTAHLEWGSARRLGRGVLRFGMHAIGDERSEEVVASIGARGVAEVRTLDGVIEIQPDTSAVRALEREVPTILELDRFIREGSLGGGAPIPRREGEEAR